MLPCHVGGLSPCLLGMHYSFVLSLTQHCAGTACAMKVVRPTTNEEGCLWMQNTVMPHQFCAVPGIKMWRLIFRLSYIPNPHEPPPLPEGPPLIILFHQSSSGGLQWALVYITAWWYSRLVDIDLLWIFLLCCIRRTEITLSGNTYFSLLKFWGVSMSNMAEFTWL
jgi:hypothetical protein